MRFLGTLFFALLSWACGRKQIFGPCEQAYVDFIRIENHTGAEARLDLAYVPTEGYADVATLAPGPGVSDVTVRSGSNPVYGKLINTGGSCSDSPTRARVALRAAPESTIRYSICEGSPPGDSSHYHVYPAGSACPEGQAPYVDRS